MSRSRAWNPWRALRARTHLRLVHAPLPPSVRGVLVDGDPRTIVLADRLSRVERNATLAHELVHDERGLLFPPGAPPALCAKEERWVSQETARRLVPLEELDELVARLEELGEPVGAAVVIEEFDVPVDVAHLALRLLRDERARRRRPGHTPWG